VTLQGPAGGAEEIGVIAETVDRSHRAEARVTVTAHDSELVLYENHPLFGILYHRAIVGDVNTMERELKITATPFFSRTLTPSSLTYAWAVNGNPIAPDPTTPETLTIAANDYSGPVDIELAAMNPADILMRSAGSWRIIFGGGSGSLFTNPLFGE
jgi:hypothetical protein